MTLCGKGHDNWSTWTSTNETIHKYCKTCRQERARNYLERKKNSKGNHTKKEFLEKLKQYEKCPECTSTKILRQCKIFHNFPALWWHLKQNHNDIFEIRMNEIILVLNNMFKASQWNMFPKWEYSEFIPNTTT